MICAPLSSPWGHLHLLLALRLGSTILLHRRFDPLQALAAIDEHQPDALALVPEMLERIMSLPRETLAWYDTSAVRVIAMRERKLARELALPAIARFGAILYSLRGPSIVALSPQRDPPSGARRPRAGSRPEPTGRSRLSSRRRISSLRAPRIARSVTASRRSRI